LSSHKNIETNGKFNTINYVKSKVLLFWAISLVGACSPVLAQDLTAKPVGIYLFTEGGAAYMPNIGLKDYSVSGVSFSEVNLMTNLGYNFLGGVGYSFNDNLSLELEAGFISNSISGISAQITGPGGSVTGTSTLTNASIQQIPICLNLVIMNPDLIIRPMCGMGFGVCPTTLDLGNRIDLTSIGGGATDTDLGSYSATPFMLKLKAGMGYAFNKNCDIGLRVFANILTGSDFGEGLKTDVYTVVGLNGNLTFRF
jgi:hypothetical protein